MKKVMDNRLSDAAEHEERCRQFAVPIGPLYNNVNLDSLSLPSLQRQPSLWTYSPSVSYQQAHQSVWHPVDSGRPVINRDIFSQSDSQYRRVNDITQFRGSDLSCHWRNPDSTAAFVGDATTPFRTLGNFDSVSDMVQSNAQSNEVNSSPTKLTQCCRSPMVVTSTNPDNFSATFDSASQQKLDDAKKGTCSCRGARTVPVHRPTPRCYHCGFQCSDRSDSFPVDEHRTVKSECVAAGNMTSCSYLEEPSPVTCKLHSVHSALSAEESTKGYCDLHAAGLHHFHPPHQQSAFTNCRNAGVKSYVVNSQHHNVRARQSASMNELDDIDLPLRNASTVNSVQTEPVENTAFADAACCTSYDAGCFTTTKPALSHSWKRELRKGIVDDPEPICPAAAKMKEKRSYLNVQNCAEDDASNTLPSFCPKLPLSSRKSKRKIHDEKLGPRSKACDVHDNLAAYNGAIDSNLCTRASEHSNRTTRVNVKSDIDHTAAGDRNGKNSAFEETNKSESLSSTAAECSEQFNADSVEMDKLSHSSESHVHAESHQKLETQSGLRHHRRSVRKTSRPAAKQKPTRHRDRDQGRTTSFRLKQFLESVDWQQQHQNIGLFFIVCFYLESIDVFLLF